MNEITLDGGTFRRIQHNGHTYWESVHPFPGVVMWFDNTDETTRPYRTLACALDRIAEMEADDAVKSEASTIRCPECWGQQCLVADDDHDGRPCEMCAHCGNGTCAPIPHDGSDEWQP